jgi:hypothetical protein
VHCHVNWLDEEGIYERVTAANDDDVTKPRKSSKTRTVTVIKIF